MISSLDTNILMRYIWRDVPGQREKAIKLLDDTDQIFYISDLVIAEIAFNLKSDHIRRSSIANILENILTKQNVRANPMIMDVVLPYYRDHPALSFVDCMAAFYAEAENQEPLWTFDRKLANQHPSAKLLN